MVNILSFKQPFYNTCFIHPYIDTLIPEAAMQGANLVIRSDTELSIQSALRFSYAQPHILTEGAIWGSASRPRTLQYAGQMSRGSNHRPSDLWMTSRCTS